MATTMSSVKKTVTGNLAQVGDATEHVSEVVADTRDQALKLGREAVERAGSQREQIGEVVQSATDQLRSMNINDALEKPARLARRQPRIALLVAGVLVLALVALTIMKLVSRRRKSDDAR